MNIPQKIISTIAIFLASFLIFFPIVNVFNLNEGAYYLIIIEIFIVLFILYKIWGNKK
jgi:hypothetical protein